MTKREHRVERAAAPLLFAMLLCGCDAPPEVWGRTWGWELPPWDPDGGGDEGGDADADADTGPDPETYVACDGEPASCEDIGATEDEQLYGCCLDGTVYWCQQYGEQWLLVWKDCAALGLACGYVDEVGYLWCS
jgi:hypothetical protein